MSVKGPIRKEGLVNIQTGSDGSFAIHLHPSIQNKDDKQDTKNIDLGPRIKGVKEKKCVGGCGATGRWRFVTRNYLCEECRVRPPHQLISRSGVQKKYKLSFQQLNEAYKSGKIEMFTTPNMYGRDKPPCHLYYVHQIEALVQPQK